MNQNLEQAIHNFRCSATTYAKTERYYRGDHDLAFATEKFANTFGSLFREFAMNLCPAICDAVKDKLRITGFGVSTTGRNATVRERAPNEPIGDTLHSDIDRIWFRNRMPQRAGELHKEALKNGDAYAVVWFDAQGEVTIYPHRASNVTVAYDDDTPGLIQWAAKYWGTSDKRVRVNIFYPDRIERYITKKESEAALPDAAEFVPFAGNAGVPPAPIAKHEKDKKPKTALQTSRLRADTIPNPFGVVPVFHFANNADVGCHGQSEMAPAIPIQDGLNKSVLDMLVAMEFSAFRQRWAAGIEIELGEDGEPKQPFTHGPGIMWVSSNADSTFGDFNSSDLDQFLKVKDSFRIDMASVTGTPLHYFLQNSGGFASGESLKQNETRFLAKVRDRQTAFGQTWAELMSFALRLAGHPNVDLLTTWEDPAPIAEKDILGNILLKKQIGLSTEQALREAGYGEMDVKRMLKG